MSRILIVDDQNDIRRLIRMSLELDDHEIHEASDGAQGLAKAQALRPDLILMDVMMPGGIDGLQACRQLKADPALAHARVVLLTARSQSNDRQAGQDAGADAYLVKPFSPLELIELTEKLLKSAV